MNQARDGGVFYAAQSSISNSVFYANTALVNGGVIYSNSNNLFMNCTFVSNNAGTAPVLFRAAGTPYITNSIVYGSPVPFGPSTVPVVTYTRLDAAYAGQGNITTDPRFVDLAATDFHLQYDSPCIDVGTNSGAPLEDYDGAVRPQGAGIDIGAYEGGAQPNIQILRSLMVQAPADYVAQGGNSTDPVPGAILSFSYNIINSGNAPAINVSMTEEIPQYTEYQNLSATCSIPAEILYQHTTPNGLYDDQAVQPITGIKWLLTAPLPAQTSVTATMNVFIK
jgi:uncharacterized repeat protein (TIGR01451 family)